jgi:hypothetical protein
VEMMHKSGEKHIKRGGGDIEISIKKRVFTHKIKIQKIQGHYKTVLHINAQKKTIIER